MVLLNPSADFSNAIWVSPNSSLEGIGTFEQPYGDIAKAVHRADPGQTVVLKKGTYRGDVTIQHAGEPDYPIRLVPEVRGAVEIVGSCWYFYEVSDFIVTGLTFRKSPFGAVSVVGACRRNIFSRISFADCGANGTASSTFFFGGSGSRDNAVDGCSFVRTASAAPGARSAGTGVVALMIAEGDAEGGTPNTNHIFRGNTFVNYGYAILVGAADASSGQYGHTVEYNTIEGCAADGVVVKCGDTGVRHNRFSGVGRHAVSIAGGTASAVEENRIVDCASGIHVCGSGHSVANNCLVRCREQAVHLSGRTRPELMPATGIFVERNTFVNCGGASSPGAAIRLDPGTSCVVEKNLFYGPAAPYVAVESIVCRGPEQEETIRDASQRHVVDNLCSGGGTAPDGCAVSPVEFAGAGKDDYENSGAHGAHGHMTSPEPIHIEAMGESDAWLALPEDDEDAPEMEGEGPAVGLRVAPEAGDAGDPQDPLMAAMFFGEDDDDSGQ